MERHRIIATQLEAIYTEINKLALKKPTEEVTALISKINHLITRVREQVPDDEFLDAIETVPVDRNCIRLDEALITLGELRSVMVRQWRSVEYKAVNDANPLEHRRQIIT